MPRFDPDTNKLLGKQPIRIRKARKINRSVGGTTTYGAQYSRLSMCADSYHAIVGRLKAERGICQSMRTFGARRGIVDMVNGAENELRLIDHLLVCADKWYRSETKYCKHEGRLRKGGD